MLKSTLILLALAAQVHAADGGNKSGNAEIDAMFEACIERFPKHAPVYARMLAPPFSCDVNWTERPRVAPGSKEYRERHAAMRALLSKEGFHGDYCHLVVGHCMEALPAVPHADKQKLLMALDDKTGKAAAALGPAPARGAASTVDAQVPDDIDALLAHPNDNTRLKGLLAIYKKRTRLPEETVDRIWRDSAMVVRHSVLQYPWLNERQIDRIIDSGERPAIYGLRRADHRDRLTDAQIGRLAALRWLPMDQHLALSAKLAPVHVQQLARNGDPETALWLAQRYQTGSVAEPFKAILAAGHTGQVYRILGDLKPVPGDVVDLVLASPDVSVRRHLTMNGAIQPTAAQIDAILRDPDPEVQIGLLRNRKIPIDRAILSKGLSHPDKNVVFWYRSRLDTATP